MNCMHCHRAFTPTEAELKDSPLAEIPYCSWECFKADERGLRWHLNSLTKNDRARFLAGKQLKEWTVAADRCRRYYHIGDVGPLPGSHEAIEEEEAYREKMRASCAANPPRLRGASLCGSADMGAPTLLPSEVFFGKAETRVLDECDIRLGGDDGDKFNFEGE